MALQNKTDANYDPNLSAAETGARQKREQEKFKELPENKSDFDTQAGSTVDREGLANNYAIEPEMYVEERGDLREENEENQRRRQQELEEVNQSGGKGPGLV
jgi:hypothetical protein